FSRLAAVAAASQADGERFRAVGASPDNIQVTGNLKFDLQIPVGLAQRGRALRDQWQAGARPVWIAASTHAGEEEIVLDAWVRLRERHPDLLLVLAPRHPQRFAAVADLLARRGMTCAKRSVDDAVDSATQVLLGDTLGELLLLFAAADLAFVGGSLVPAIGGHNLLEPAALALPLTTGPHLGGWGEVAGWLEQAGALRRVLGAAELARATACHLDDAAARGKAGRAGAVVVAAHRGALERSLALLATLGIE
ncbi:MAG: hypothetical protein L0H83_11345, partial [Salinisphaera sp.]|nr:hypothetical protein [Salinisphaera sp.]